MSSTRFAKWAAVSQETRKAAKESKRMALSVSTVDKFYDLFLVFETAALQFVVVFLRGVFFFFYIGRIAVCNTGTICGQCIVDENA